MNEQRPISIIGAPFDEGSRRRGCVMGPDALRVSDLIEKLGALGHDVEDAGNLAPAEPVNAIADDSRVKNLPEAAIWTRAINQAVADTAARGCFPLILGGDHTIAMGTVTGMNAYAASVDRPLFVLWLDAHTDFNTFDTSPTGNIHGMPVAFFCGAPGFDTLLGGPIDHPVDPKNVCMMGIRSVDDHERALVADYGITVHDMRAIDEHGVIAPLRAFLDQVRASNGLLHVSFDVDFLEPEIAPAVGTTVPGGATVREAHLIMELVYDSGLLSSLEVAELNPIFDIAGKTSALMVELVASAFGQRILDRP